jgi:putative tryptophan/tyrosine transport system substrate-binding protein
MRRREFIGVLGGAAGWPLVARAQQAGKIYRVGFLANDPTIPTQLAGEAFVDGLRESGFVEGKNVVIERRFAEGRLDRYADLVAELMKLDLDLIVASTSAATVAVKRANDKLPVVMLNVVDPVGLGLVASLSHPGGNVTGLTQEDSAEITTKRVQFLKDVVPQASRVAVLMDPDVQYNQAQWKQLQLAAPPLNITLQPLVVKRADEFETAFAGIERDRPDALFVAASWLNFTYRRLIVETAAKSRLPTMSGSRESTEAGGLISYGFIRADQFRRAAIFVGKILKGAKPSDLPIEQPNKYELVINLKTARVLNLEIPRSLLLVADEVIE